MAGEKLYGLESYRVRTGNGETPEATVRLRREEVLMEASSEGDGPIDAIFKAIDKVVGAFHKLEDWQAFGDAEPNAVHHAVRDLERAGRLLSLVGGPARERGGG